MSARSVFYRTATADLEVRGGDGRTVRGIAVPFDSPATISEAGRTFVEQFRFGAFARTIRERGDKVKFLAQHDRRSLPLGKATLLREDVAGLYGEFHVSETRQGDEVLALIRDGALYSFSVGFRLPHGGDRWSRDGGEREITEAVLHEVSVVAFPAYDDAVITGIRADDFISYADVAALVAAAESR